MYSLNLHFKFTKPLLQNLKIDIDARMAKLLGYGEDFLTLWAIKERTGTILKKHKDQTPTTECLVFYRPSFGRSGGPHSAEFGEFDAIIASKQNIYLIESKWDNLKKHNKTKLNLEKEQLLRHEVFAWYLVNWNKKYIGQWQNFVDDNIHALNATKKKLPNYQRGKRKLLIENLEFALLKLKDHCTGFRSRANVKNVILFFYNSKTSKPPTETNPDYTLIPLDYNKKLHGNYIEL